MAKTSNSQKLQETKDQILDALDIQAEYEALGVEVTGGSPNGDGWIEARSYGRDDNNPSAGINVTPGDHYGKYSDFSGGICRTSGGVTESLWDFATRTGRFIDWFEALIFYAEKAGVELPNTKFFNSRKSVKFNDAIVLPAMAGIFAGHKEGYSAETVIATGARTAITGADGPEMYQQNVLVWPMYSSFSVREKPCGFHFARVDGSPVRIPYKDSAGQWQEKLTKSASKGDCGVFNERGIDTCGQYSTVLWCEGLSDTLAAQEMVGLDNSSFSVLGLPGASQRLPREHGGFLATQEAHWVVYDGDEAGAAGAAALAADLVAFGAKSVRIVQMPDGKDMRDWINEGNGLHELDALAESASELVPEDEADRPTPSGNLAESAGLDVLGKDGDHIVVYVRASRKVVKLTKTDIRCYSFENLVSDFGGKAIRSLVYRSKKDDDIVGKVGVSEFRCMLAEAAFGKTVDTADEIRQGVWRNDGQLVLINGDLVDFINDSGKLEPFVGPRSGKSFITTDSASSRWYDRELLSEYLILAADESWRRESMDKLIGYYSLWGNWDGKLIPEIRAGLIVAMLVPTLLEFRPHFLVVGGTDTGKSALRKMEGPFFGSLALCISRGTAAAVRQKTRNSGKPLIVDEIDKFEDIKKLLAMLRVSTTGGTHSSGGRDGNATESKMQIMASLSGISLDTIDKADWNRIITMKLNDLPENEPRELVVPGEEDVVDLKHRLLACVLTRIDDCLETVNALRNTPMSNGRLFPDSRLEQCYSVPIGFSAAIRGASVETAQKTLRSILEPLKGSVCERDVDMDMGVSALNTIMAHKVFIGTGMTKSIGALLAQCHSEAGFPTASGEATHQKMFDEGVVYIRVTRRGAGTPEDRVAFHIPTVVNVIFKDKENRSAPLIRHALKAIEGCNPKELVRVGLKRKCFSVPYSVLMEHLLGGPSDEDVQEIPDDSERENPTNKFDFEDNIPF